MTAPDLLRYTVAGLACTVSGATAVVFALYLQAWITAPSGSGILPRHVALVSLGTLGLVVGVGLGVYDTLGDPTMSWRTWLYLASLALILAAVVEVGRLQRSRLAELRDTGNGRHHR